MNKYFKYTGGANIGWHNVTYPLANFQIGYDELILNAGFLGKYYFKKDQIVGIKRYVVIPFLGWGVQIEHNVSSYPKKMIFWSLTNPNNVLAKIKDKGFIAKGRSDVTTPANLSSINKESIVTRNFALFIGLFMWLAFILMFVWSLTSIKPPP